MIKSNLAVLMAERGLKMVDVIEQTGIAKATIQGLYHNTNKAIHYQTIDTLCNFFNVPIERLLLHIKSNVELISVKKIHPLKLEYQIRIRVNDAISDHSFFADITKDDEDDENSDNFSVILTLFETPYISLEKFFTIPELRDQLLQVVKEGAIRALEVAPQLIRPVISFSK